MFKQWIKAGFYMIAGTIRSFDYEWNVSNCKPTLDRFGELTEDGSLTDEECGIVCRELAGAEEVSPGLQTLLYGMAWLFDQRWVDFEWSCRKYRAIYEDLHHWWGDGKFTTKEWASWTEKIADTITT